MSKALKEVKKKDIPEKYLELLFKKWYKDGSKKLVPTDIIQLIAKYLSVDLKNYWVSIVKNINTVVKDVNVFSIQPSLDSPMDICPCTCTQICLLNHYGS